MKALILNSVVVDVSETEFPVSSEMSWMDCPNDCQISWILKDGVITAPPEPPAKTYDILRQEQYPYIGDQLDDLYHAGAFSASMTATLKKVKDDNPKG